MKLLSNQRIAVSSPSCFWMAVVAGIMVVSPLSLALDADGDGVPDDWELAHQGILSVWPPALGQTLLPYNTAPRSFLLNNDTSSAVTYTATLSNNTVPLYSALDSITGGITYPITNNSTNPPTLGTAILPWKLNPASPANAANSLNISFADKPSGVRRRTMKKSK